MLLTTIFYEINVVLVSGHCQSYQQELLLQFKNELDFDESLSLKLVGWNQSLDCCMWEGVTCDVRGRVIGLDLSDEWIFGGLKNSGNLFDLQHLQSLNLANNDFGSNFPSRFDKLSNLTHLILSHAGLIGKTPIDISRMTSLVTLDLSVYADFYFGLKLENPILVMLVQDLEELKHLYLDGVNILAQGNEWCQTLSSLANLQVLSMSNCNLSSPIDSSLSKLQSLSAIRLDGNNLSGQFPEKIFQNKFWGDFTRIYWKPGEAVMDRACKLPFYWINSRSDGKSPTTCLSKLVSINLRDNALSGALPPALFGIPSLRSLVLSQNQFTGGLHEPPELASSSLLSLELDSNMLDGPFPMFVFKLQSLQVLILAFNNFNLCGNNLQGPLPQLSPFLAYVDYSNNKFSSIIQFDDGNSILKSIPYSISFSSFMSLSNNSLQGSIPESICNVTNLIVLDLSNNNLSGTIPQCLTRMESLKVLDLSRNSLSGNITGKFSSNCLLQTLDLNGNHLEEKVPRSLANCAILEVLNLGNNQINDTFPCHLKNISNLQILGRTPCHWLQTSTAMMVASNEFKILVLKDHLETNFEFNINGIYDTLKCTASNTLHRKNSEGIHCCQGFYYQGANISQGQDANISQGFYYQDAVTITIKGSERQLVKIPNHFTSIDFSCNKFVGQILEVLGEFKALYALNLSHNGFTSLIPSSLGNLHGLESLDLSSNNLSGQIPQYLGDLNFLAVLDFSHNQLEGRIPSGSQFQTFSEDSFKDNKELCGIPLKENCSVNVLPPSKDNHSDDGTHIDWNILSIELGFIFGLGIVILPLMLCKRWRVWYCKHTDGLLSRFIPILNQRSRSRGTKPIEEQAAQSRDFNAALFTETDCELLLFGRRNLRQPGPNDWKLKIKPAGRAAQLKNRLKFNSSSSVKLVR
ncbi:hypothetical protein SLEP1_g31932 [Rubroshorea leprosula]|uniref:Leucine-rich repeat-containing N-terminal plant-type domain-containing protein n=1 Tax=Rubroshorea leprosula TaxID=152421 RepID=A0AAV5KBR0_9ROSI|nr:hypothetical protein SLEP1_g31932 [Rubroshorea leprosula]